ncbi:unnamed protein product [Porites lobata]|uniref:DUF1508 domain-containing protein n=1 Tax=Porites lobata TaxID=104759 RepID=A0ABN8RBM3_9CNID|nr:unnamed protein product [Porites lobata]
MGNVEKTYNTRQYQFTLRTYSGKNVSVTTFGMDKISGPATNEKQVISRNQTNVVESFTGRNMEREVENFICGEDLGTEITPRCCTCRCEKFPVVGHTYSFKDE